jgi:hypothetical protein
MVADSRDKTLGAIASAETAEKSPDILLGFFAPCSSGKKADPLHIFVKRVHNNQDG